MNRSKTAIIVDSGCDISEELINRYDIRVMRLKVMYGETVYSDGLDIDPMEVYRRFPADIPTTSTPNMAEVMEVVQQAKQDGYENVIGITISSGLSGTYNAMALTFRELEGMKAFAFDSKNISIGAGLFAIWAAQELEGGAAFEQVVEGLNRKLGDSKVFFYMDTLEYLKKGGRITPAVAIVGKVLNLKPVISCNSKGVYYTVAKIRGAGRGISKLLEVATEFAGDSQAMLGLMNGDGAAAAGQVRPVLQERIPGGTIVVDKQITATMAVHTGPGLIGIGVLKL